MGLAFALAARAPGIVAAREALVFLRLWLSGDLLFYLVAS